MKKSSQLLLYFKEIVVLLQSKCIRNITLNGIKEQVSQHADARIIHQPSTDYGFKKVFGDEEIMRTEQQQVYMRSLNRYRTFLASKDYDYNRGHEEGRAEGRINSARLMIAAGVPEALVLSTLSLNKEDL